MKAGPGGAHYSFHSHSIRGLRIARPSAPFAAGQDQDVEGSKALTTKCAVPAGCLWAYGSGPYVPVASNDSEDGRAKNRRVELVKQ